MIFRCTDTKLNKAQHVYVVVEDYKGGTTIQVCQRGQKEEDYKNRKEDLNKIRLNFNLDINKNIVKGRLLYFHIPDDINVVEVSESDNAYINRYGSSILRKSDKYSEYVKNMQEDLMKIGYDLGESGADGYFGNKTILAVKLFQKQYGLKVDGLFGKNTKEKLYNIVMK